MSLKISRAIKLGIGGVPFGNKGGVSWTSYWSSQSEVLFFGLYSEIADGKMPNKKTGATDYLTIAGVAGSETYQVPNTVPYIAADTDYIWFKTDATPRTTTTAELIGYDLQRTPVKYLDDAPNTIEAILILSSAISASKRDRLFKDFHLSQFWDNDLNVNGYVKSNRSGSQLLWTPELITDIDSDAFIARMGTAPSAALAALIDKTFVDLKAADVYDSLVQFTKCNIHNETDAKLNWIGDTFPVALISTPTYTAKKGWLATTNKALKSGFVPSVQIAAGTIGVDDCGILIDKFESAGDLGTFKLNGSFKTGANTVRYQLTSYSAGLKKCACFLNCAITGTVNQNDDVAGADGVFYGERTSGVCTAYYNKVKTYDYTVAGSNATDDNELFFGALQSEADSAVYFSAEYIRTIVICKYLGATKQAALYDIIKYFNDNVGGTF